LQTQFFDTFLNMRITFGNANSNPRICIFCMI